MAPKDKHTKPVGTHHVVDLVETGDFEGVMSWVIGLDGQRPFTANAHGGGRPRDQHLLNRPYHRQSRMTLPNVASEATSSYASAA